MVSGEAAHRHLILAYSWWITGLGIRLGAMIGREGNGLARQSRDPPGSGIPKPVLGAPEPAKPQVGDHADADCGDARRYPGLLDRLQSSIDVG